MRFTAWFLLTAASSFSQPVSPFTAVEISRQFDARGNLKSESRFLFAMNRDGSIASVDLDPRAAQTRQIIDVVNHRTITIDPTARSAIAMPYGAFRSEPTNACEQRFYHIHGADVAVDRSAQTLQGVTVDRVSVHMPHGGSMQVLLAPSLGCHMLQILFQRNGVTLETQISERLQLGDPDRSLFEVPGGYRLTNGAPSLKGQP
jgi:hypothetical protein